MTVPDADRLVRLLPTAHRMRDAEVGGPLAALLRVIAEQVQVVDDDIGRLYENWFIETCEAWVVPYIGDLIGYLPAAPLTTSSSIAPEERERELRAAVPRRDVAHMIGDRRRKGSLALLEDLARDAAGWPARAVELYRLLALAQSIDHVRLGRGRTVDLRAGDALDRVDGPFDELAHTVSVGRITSRRRRTRHNIPSVGLYVWRLRPYSVTRATAYCIDRARNHYTFSLLSVDTPLMTKPVAEPSRTHVADETNVPAWISRRGLDERTFDYYGRGKSIAIWRDSLDKLVPAADIVAADLSHWAYRPRGNQVALDPVLGRIAFASGHAPDRGVWVTYQYGFSADMGGGEYRRALSPRVGRPAYRVGRGSDYTTIMDAIRRWQEDRSEDPSKRSAVVEIVDSDVYEDEIDFDLAAGDRLEIRAAQGRRPVIHLLERHSSRVDSLRIRGVTWRAGEEEPADPPQIVFDGLLVVGRSVWISGRVGCVVIRHCTLVPGWSLEHDCEPRAEEPSLVLEHTQARVVVDRSIVGGVRVLEDQARTDPIPFALSDSILDATKPTATALCAPDGRRAHVVLTVEHSTVIGEVDVFAVQLAENSIFLGRVRVARRRPGCMRFCYVAERSRTPDRYSCQPDLVQAAVRAAFARGELSADARDRALVREANRVRPQFESVRYATPQYCQLAETCAPEIRRGADDESELGAFHDLFQPQREDTLRARLEEFSPAGSDAGIIFVT